VIETNDLIYEGIATCYPSLDYHASSFSETNDLIYEGIATLRGAAFVLGFEFEQKQTT